MATTDVSSPLFIHTCSILNMIKLQAYGINYGLVYEREKLDEAIKQMVNTEGPYLLEVGVNPEGNVLPMTPQVQVLTKCCSKLKISTSWKRNYIHW